MTLELAGGLQQLGWQLSVVTSRWGDGELSRRLRELDIPDYPMRLGFISAKPRLNEIKMTADQIIHLPSLYSAFRKFLREKAPTRIVHTNWQHVLLLLPFLQTGRDILWVHEVMPNKSLYRKLFGHFARRIGMFVAVSNAVRQSIVDLGVPEDQVVTIHNGISPFPVAERSSSSQGVRIGIVGQVGDWKGHGDLIEAFADLGQRHPQCELHIFGAVGAPYTEDLRRLIENLNLNDRVHWHGFQSDRSRIYVNIDICVVPSRFEEPFGLVAVEAGMAGLPCIATRRGGLPEIIEDGATGILVDAERPAQLSGALEKLIIDPDLRAQMGTAARHRVGENFSRERFLQQFADLLEK